MRAWRFSCLRPWRRFRSLPSCAPPSGGLGFGFSGLGFRVRVRGLGFGAEKSLSYWCQIGNKGIFVYIYIYIYL